MMNKKKTQQKESSIPSHKFGVCNEGKTLFVRGIKIVHQISE